MKDDEAPLSREQIVVVTLVGFLHGVATMTALILLKIAGLA